MALVHQSAGTANAASGASPTTVATTVALAVGDVLVVAMAYDNSGTSGADPLTNFAAAPASGAMTVVSTQTGLNDPGAASAGVAARVNAYYVTSTIASGTNISISWTGTLVVRAIALVKVNSNSGAKVAYRTNSGATGANTVASAAPALTTPSVTSGELVLCWAAHENGANITGDADTTNGSWGTIITTFNGTGATGMAVGVQGKTVTATGTQAFNPTGTSSDWILSSLIFNEVTAVTPATRATTWNVAAPPAALYSDDFNRADSGSLGGLWIGTLTLVSNKAVAPPPSSFYSSRYNASISADQWSECDVVVVPNANGNAMGPAVRMGVATNDLYFVNYDSATENVDVQRRDGGGSFAQVIAPVSTVGTGGAFKARLEAQGSTIRLYLNGALAGTATDTSVAVGGQAGLWGGNFGDTPTADNWRGGDLPYTPAGSTTPVSASRATTWNVAAPTTSVSASRATTWNVAATGGGGTPWTNRVVIAAPANGTTSHTVDPSSSGTVVSGAAFTPTAGRFLLCVVEGQVTSTTPSGWTLPTNGAAVNNTGLYVFYRTAAGSDTLVTTHNGSNYVVGFAFYEFPAGTTFVSAAFAVSLGANTANPTISGLTGTNHMMTAHANGRTIGSPGTATVWTAPVTAESDTADVSTTLGYRLSIGKQEAYTSASWTPVRTADVQATAEGLSWALKLPGGGTTPVSASRATTWNVAGVSSVSASRSTTWNVRAPSLKLGTLPIATAKLGTQQVQKMYLGSTQVYANKISPVVAENALVGDAPANWFSTTTFDANIRGFATAMSVEVGSGIDFKVDSSSTAYTIDIYRLGWYGGNGARKITTLNGTAVTQPTGTLRTSGEGAVGSRDCTNWSTTNTWTVPSNQVHGWHLAVLRRTGQSTFNYGGMFVVTNAANRAAKIKVKSSDMTWQAYNNWGSMASPTQGGSLYGVSQGVFSQGSRSWDVSYDRPLGVLPVSADATMVPQTHPFNGELPLWSWLERNGYDVGYVTALDVDKGSMSFTGASVVCCAGHDEYWSDNVRAAWDNAIAGGAHGIVFSGNTLLWRTRTGTGVDARRIYCYKNSHSLDGTGSGIDPVTWTGTWRDPRWTSRDPEARSIGTMFISNGIRADEIAVPFAYKNNPIWRNTSVTGLSSGGTWTLKNDVLGMEWDTYTTYYANSMAYPPRLALLSEATVDLTNNTAAENGSIYTNTVPGGNVKHYITAYPTPAGKMVVNFGCNQWGWGLSDFHCRGATGVDTVMQQATINLLADMGQQPATIHSGVSAATQTAWTWPTITSIAVTPSSTSVQVPNTKQLAATATWSNGVTTDVTTLAAWSSNATGNATVGAATGLVTGVAAGSATVTALYLGQSNTCAVTVTAASTLIHVWTTPTPGADISDGQAYEMGTEFSMVSAKTLGGARIWNPGAVTLARNIRLWNVGTSTQMNVWACPSILSPGWNDITVTPTVALSPGVSYCLSYNVDGPNDYGYVTSGLNVAKGDGTMSLDAGRYGTAPGAFPNNRVGTFYGVDVLYS